jgi:hypothetical protein
MPNRPLNPVELWHVDRRLLGSAPPRRLELSNDADSDRVGVVRSSCEAILVGGAGVLPTVVHVSPTNARYLATKARRGAHTLDVPLSAG